MTEPINLHINGQDYDVAAPSHRTLLQVLRDDLGFTGAKNGCTLGTCGCCTVLIDNHPALACLTLAHSTAGHTITTIEGLAQDGVLHPLQEAFLELGAVQCGYCTPGMILTAKALLDEEPEPTEEQIRQALSGNLCRCTGYQAIINAVKLASKHLLAGRGTSLETSSPSRWHDLNSKPPER